MKIMKALRYLLIVVGLVSVLSVYAQSLAQQPEATMQSTSVMMTSGSTLPQAAVTGTYTAGDAPGTYSISKPGRPRRVGENEGTEDEEDPDNPGEPFPIGDVTWPFMLLTCVYVLIRYVRTRKRAEASR